MLKQVQHDTTGDIKDTGNRSIEYAPDAGLVASVAAISQIWV
ncbi:MAG TPA: hypothetical protein VJ964_06980 [Balneolaceae bacterium]|nr:hypothetical protein [Balneolaceae bacterium]